MPDKPSTCSECPAFTKGRGFIPFEGPRSKICLLGHGPNELDTLRGQHFHPEEAWGFLLNKWLNKAQLLRSQTLVGNLVQCFLPKYGGSSTNREPTREEAQYCYKTHVEPRLREDGFWKDDRLIVPVGDFAAEFLLGHPKVSRYRGTFNERPLPKGRELQGK